MRFNYLDAQSPRRTHARFERTELVNVSLLRKLLNLAEEGRFTPRTTIDELAARLDVHRATVYRQLAIAERALGVVIRVDPEEARLRVVSWGALNPSWWIDGDAGRVDSEHTPAMAQAIMDVRAYE